MTLKLLFNPISGTLDYVDVAAAGAGYVGPPTTIRAAQTFTVPDDTQMLTAVPIVYETGASLALGANSVHVAVS